MVHCKRYFHSAGLVQFFLIQYQEDVKRKGKKKIIKKERERDEETMKKISCFVDEYEHFVWLQ